MSGPGDGTLNDSIVSSLPTDAVYVADAAAATSAGESEIAAEEVDQETTRDNIIYRTSNGGL